VGQGLTPRSMHLSIGNLKTLMSFRRKGNISKICHRKILEGIWEQKKEDWEQEE
jgi:hypothetical protein